MALVSRRGALRAAAALPLLAVATRTEGDEYATAAEVFAAIDSREAEVAVRLRVLARAVPAAAPLAESVLRDHERFRAERARLRERLRLVPAPAALAATGSDAGSPGAGAAAALPPIPPAGVDADLQALRDALDRLVYAHAEGLPAVGDARAVHGLATHMVEHARHLTIVDLWLEQERG